MPVKADTFSESLRMGTEVFHTLKKVLHEKGFSTNVGDEGGFAPNIKSNEEAIEIVLKAIEKAGFKPGVDIFIAMDAASSNSTMQKQRATYSRWDWQEIEVGRNGGVFGQWAKKYPIISIEDENVAEDWTGWKGLTDKIGNKVQLVGDDLFVTNVDFLQKGIDMGVANSILVKVNQIGTLTETINAVNLAKRNSYKTIISHRSGKTEDSTIADLAVALNTGQIKTGSASRSDRMAKYNQLIRIEEELGETAYFPGKNF